MALLALFLFSHICIVSTGLTAESDEEKVLSLIERFKSTDKKESYEAHMKLVGLGKLAVPGLIPYLKDINTEIRRKAAFTLGAIGPSAVEAVPDLLELLQNPDETDSVCREAARAIGLVGPAAALDLLQAMKNADKKTLYFIEYAQGFMLDSASPALLKALKHDDPAIPNLAAITLGRGGFEAEKTIPLLIEIIDNKNEDEYVRKAASESLGRYGETARKATGPLLKAAIDSGEPLDIRNAAVLSLGLINPSPDEVFLPLVNLLRSADENELVRMNTAKALGRMGEPSEDITNVLISIIKDQDSPAAVRGGAALGLGYMKSKAISAIPELIDMLKDADFRVQKDVISALANIPPEGDKADPELKTKLPFIVNWLENGTRKQMLMGIIAIAHIGPAAATATPTLLSLLNSKEENMIRRAATRAIGYISSGDPAVIAALNKIIRSGNEDVRLREIAILSLAQTSRKADSDLWSLSDLFQDDQTSNLLGKAYGVAIVQVEPKNRKLLPAIIKALDNPNKNLREVAAFFLWISAKNLQTGIEEIPLSELKALSEGLKKATIILEESGSSPALLNLYGNPEITFAKELEIREGTLLVKILLWSDQNKILSGFILYIVFMPALWFIILLISPLSILKINNVLTPVKDIKFSGWMGSLNLPIRLFLMIKPFVYHRRVLDAWVSAHAPDVLENYLNKQTVKDRSVFVNIPVVLDGSTKANLSSGHLNPIFNKQRVRLLIRGEGGSGKTSLACQIGLWALSDDRSKWICNHRMLPVLIEHDLDDIASVDKSAVLRAIQGQVDDLVGKAGSISEEFLKNLLIQRRLLVIIDHLSEMSGLTRSQVRPELPEFYANALIITSRIEEPLGGVTKSTCKPLRISGNRLSSFMEAYLTQRGKRELFNDSEFFAGCQKLSAMVSERQITVLMAKLFAEQMILKKRKGRESEVPTNVPGLMLSYLNELYHNASRDELRSVQGDAKIIAWECLKSNFRPAAADYNNVIRAMGNDSVERRLKILENDLRLITTIGAAQDKIRFNLDPLAEYLAALFLVDTYKEDKKFWKSIIDRIEAKHSDFERIKEFVIALHECWTVNEMSHQFPVIAKELDLLRRKTSSDFHQ